MSDTATPTPKSELVSIRLTKDLVDKLMIRAKAEGVGLSTLVREILAEKIGEWTDRSK